MTADPFVGLEPTRPRLMATAAAIKRVEVAVAHSEVGKKLKARVIRRADELLHTDTGPVKWKCGDLLDESREALRRLQALGMAWFLVKDMRYAKRATLELNAICGFPDWNAAHFLDTAGMTHAAAIGYDWFYDQLTDIEREKCVDAILKKGLGPGLAQLTGNPDPAWPSRTTNWNIVCNAGLIIGALAVGVEATDLTRQVFRRCLDSVPTGFRGYSPDGSWDEGPGYWSYATEYAAYLLSALQTAVHHEFGLGDLPGVGNSGRFRMHAEGSAAASNMAALLFNFSDCDETHSGSWCMRWLSLRYKRPEYNGVALQDGQTKPMDLLWFSPDAPTNDESIPRNALFRGVANVAMLRGKENSKSLSFRAWERHHLDTVYLGIRAGGNSLENHHGHLDLGSFVLDARQLRWAIDLPPAEEKPPYAAEYDLPGYFDMSRRFRYYRTGTIGHNTLVINGQNQPLGIQTEIVGFAAVAELAVAVVDLTAAYPDCLRVRRGFALIERQHVLIVDEVTPKQYVNVAWQMHTRATATGGSTARLEQKGKEFFVQMLEPAGTVFEMQPAPVTQPREAPNTGVLKLVANFPNVETPSRIAVFLSAQRELPSAWPEPLQGPLWSWIEWAGKHQDPKAELS